MPSKKVRIEALEHAKRVAAIGTKNLVQDEIEQPKPEQKVVVTEQLLKEWVFWTWEQRRAIAEELLARRAKDLNAEL